MTRGTTRAVVGAPATAPDAPARRLHLERTFNTRDVGGYPAAGGKRTRWGAVLRSDSLHALTPGGRAALLAWGLRTVVDLRHAAELSAAPAVFAGAERPLTVHLPLVDGALAARERHLADGRHSLETLYRAVLDERREAVGRFFAVVGDPARRPLLVHCTAGKDRTGLLIALLLAALDVPPATIAADYAVSAAYLTAEWVADHRASVEARGVDWEGYKANLDCAPELMLSTLEYLDERHGGAGPYLATAGIGPDAVAALRAALLE